MFWFGARPEVVFPNVWFPTLWEVHSARSAENFFALGIENSKGALDSCSHFLLVDAICARSRKAPQNSQQPGPFGADSLTESLRVGF